MLVGKKPKGWYESSGCEIQRWVEKGFAGFVCFGYKKVKLYVIAFIYGNSCLIRGNLCLQKGVIYMTAQCGLLAFSP